MIEILTAEYRDALDCERFDDQDWLWKIAAQDARLVDAFQRAHKEMLSEQDE